MEHIGVRIVSHKRHCLESQPSYYLMWNDPLLTVSLKHKSVLIKKSLVIRPGNLQMDREKEGSYHLPSWLKKLAV